MKNDHYRLQVKCRHCGHAEICRLERMTGWLSQSGMLRRAPDTEPQFIMELFTSAVPSLACTECGERGLDAVPIVEQVDGNWGEAPACEQCGSAMAADRLEVFSNATLCAECQADLDKGKVPEEPDYCPRCGALMELSPSRGAGVARYVMRCSECGR